jgi:hypothetical protein
MHVYTPSHRSFPENFRLSSIHTYESMKEVRILSSHMLASILTISDTHAHICFVSFRFSPTYSITLISLFSFSFFVIRLLFVRSMAFSFF